MGFKAQFPPFVAQAISIGALHRTFCIEDYLSPSVLECDRAKSSHRTGEVFEAKCKAPLSVQAPNPSKKLWYGQFLKTACVTLRYGGGWELKVYLHEVTGGHTPWNWRLLCLELEHHANSGSVRFVNVKKRWEGKSLAEMVVGKMGCRIHILACEENREYPDHPTRTYRFPNKETILLKISATGWPTTELIA